MLSAGCTEKEKTNAAARKTNGAGFIFDLLSPAENAKQIFHDVCIPCVFVRTSDEKKFQQY